MTGLTSQEYQFDGRNVRVSLAASGDLLFVAKDVCDCLDINHYRNAISRLDEDERGSVVINTLGGEQTLSAITESGLYALIFQSRKPEAKQFRKWVTSEVIPAIRKQGYYLHNPTPESEAVIKLRLRLKAAELREEASKLDALARGDHEIVTEVPVGYMPIDTFLIDGEHASPETLASVRSRVLGRLRGAKPLTQRVPAKPGSGSGSRRRRLFRTIDLHNAAVAAGLMQITLTFTPEA